MLGQELRNAREYAGLTLKEACQFLGVGDTKMWKIETENYPYKKNKDLIIAIENAIETLQDIGKTKEREYSKLQKKLKKI